MPFSSLRLAPSVCCPPSKCGIVNYNILYAVAIFLLRHSYFVPLAASPGKEAASIIGVLIGHDGMSSLSSSSWRRQRHFWHRRLPATPSVIRLAGCRHAVYAGSIPRPRQIRHGYCHGHLVCGILSATSQHSQHQKPFSTSLNSASTFHMELIAPCYGQYGSLAVLHYSIHYHSTCQTNKSGRNEMDVRHGTLPETFLISTFRM